MHTATGDISSNLPGSSSGAAVRSPSISYPFLHQQQQQEEADHPIMIPIHPEYTDEDGDEFPRRDERSPQWSNQETRGLIEIRAQLEWGSERNDNFLWDMIADRMREKGYMRTADHCKCKWVNLVTSYKGEEVSDVDNVQPCPFFNELHELFTMRAKRMQQGQAGGIVKGRKRLKTVSEDLSLEEEQEDVEEITVASKRKDGREKRPKMGEKDDNLVPSVSFLKGVEQMMRSFMVQQEMVDIQWRELMEKKAEEREAFEQEWRQKMEKLESEKLMMEQAWREREEERREREERRAEKRDALLSTLLNKLIHDQSP
ncbi:hypothetical protein ACS0TY_022454 [Phlomoides rotata]